MCFSAASAIGAYPSFIPPHQFSRTLPKGDRLDTTSVVANPKPHSRSLHSIESVHLTWTHQAFFHFPYPRPAYIPFLTLPVAQTVNSVPTLSVILRSAYGGCALRRSPASQRGSLLFTGIDTRPSSSSRCPLVATSLFAHIALYRKLALLGTLRNNFWLSSLCAFYQERAHIAAADPLAPSAKLLCLSPRCGFGPSLDWTIKPPFPQR